MTRYGIETDEWYPVYELGDDPDRERWIDLTDAEYADYKAAYDAFEAWQQRLRDAGEDGDCRHCGGSGCVACSARYLPSTATDGEHRRTCIGVPSRAAIIEAMEADEARTDWMRD